MYIFLSGAKKNVGDFLIGDRAVNLLRIHRPDVEIDIWDRWQSLDNRLDEINASRALILGGGPAYQRSLYPGVFPLVSDLSQIKIPIVPMGLGWGGRSMLSINEFQFSDVALKAIKKFHGGIAFSSCRDHLTLAILQQNQIHNVLMTGCPAWYEPSYIGAAFHKPKHFEKIVITTAQAPEFVSHNIKLVDSVRLAYPEAQIYCVFHRGIEKDQYTPAAEATRLQAIKDAAVASNCEIIDAAYDLEKIGFYKECDLHIGYRVHAHIYFLSVKRPSFLFHEDGRGVGVSSVLGLPDVTAFEGMSKQLTVVDRFPGVGYKRELLVDDRSIDTMLSTIVAEQKNDFSKLERATKLMEGYYHIMQCFLASLP